MPSKACQQLLEVALRLPLKSDGREFIAENPELLVLGPQCTNRLYDGKGTLVARPARAILHRMGQQPSIQRNGVLESVARRRPRPPMVRGGPREQHIPGFREAALDAVSPASPGTSA